MSNKLFVDTLMVTERAQNAYNGNVRVDFGSNYLSLNRCNFPTGLPGTDNQVWLVGSSGVGRWADMSGATGLPGATGAYGGPPGATGAMGMTGALGTQGATGERGLRGITGRDGIQGDMGDQGETGAIGQTGLRGVTGLIGQTGARGVTGALGNTGAYGPTGFMGVTGLIGQTGAKGATGLQGITGTRGTTYYDLYRLDPAVKTSAYDAGIDSIFPNSNLGIQDTVLIGPVGPEPGFFKWDIPQNGDIVQSATIRLFHNYTAYTGSAMWLGNRQSFSIKRVLKDWSEGNGQVGVQYTGITYGHYNAPGDYWSVTGCKGAGTDYDPSEIGSGINILSSYYEFENFSFNYSGIGVLQRMIDGEIPNYGFMISVTGLEYDGTVGRTIFGFHSSEYTGGTDRSHAPRLIINNELAGDRGSTGSQGVTGLVGNQGVTGLRGTTGLQGVTGLIGNTGSQGVTGFQGVTGLVGLTGAQGTATGPAYVPLTDYSASSVTGWSTTTTKVIHYRKIDKQVTVYFLVQGDSNGTMATIPCVYPQNGAASMQPVAAIKVRDLNTSATTSGYCVMSANTYNIQCFKDWSGTAFTNTGIKSVQGTYIYETA